MVALQCSNNLKVLLKERLERFESEWLDISSSVASAFNMDDQKKAWLSKKNVARLIAAIPYLAGCDIARQTAASHLSIYILSVSRSSKPIFFHQQWVDDNEIMNRLRPIMNFHGGDAQIIERGMNLLALNMVCGYERDVQKDSINAKYNPVGSKAWDYKLLKNKLISRISDIDLPEMDQIMDIKMSVKTFWGA